MANWHKWTQQSDLQRCPLNLIHLWYVYQMKTAVLSSLFSCPNNESLAPSLPWFQIKAVVSTALWAVRPLLPRIPSWSQSSWMSRSCSKTALRAFSVLPVCPFPSFFHSLLTFFLISWLSDLYFSRAQNFLFISWFLFSSFSCSF